jgi:F-type H+-transporting ATPase subunit b
LQPALSAKRRRWPHTGGEKMQIISNVALISINETFLVQLVSFLIFLFILNRIMIRPLRDVMQERQDRMADIQQEMTDARTELEENVRQIRKKEADVLKAANDFRTQLEEDGNQQARQITAAARSEVEGMRRTSESEIMSLVSKARKDLQAESETVATRIMEKILDRRLDS